MSTTPKMKRAVTEERLTKVSEKLVATSQQDQQESKSIRPQDSAGALPDSGLGTENTTRKSSEATGDPSHQSSADPPIEAVYEEAQCPVLITVEEEGSSPKAILNTSILEIDRSNLFLLPRKTSTSSIASFASEDFVTAPSTPLQTVSRSIPIESQSPPDLNPKEIEINLSQSDIKVLARAAIHEGRLHLDISIQSNLSIQPNTDATRRRRRSFASSCSSSCPSPISPKLSQSVDDSHTPPIDLDEIIKRLLHEKLDDFVRYTDLGALYAHLVSAELLSTNDLEELQARYKTSRARNLNFYMIILPSKGSDAYKRMFDCLKREQEHLGHKYLVKIIEKGLD